MKKVFVRGVEKGSDEETLEKKIIETFLEASDKLSWLSKGETVLLKPALNSGNSYPATTHPAVIRVIKKEIEDRGGKVIVGDQSGIGWVLQGERGVVRGSSVDCFVRSGMAECGAYLTAFEEGDWDDSFTHFESGETKSWPDGFFVTDWIGKVDHIISLPRIATHGQAGATLGFKNMVGILREDSRVRFHSYGPYYFAISKSAKGSGIKTNYKEKGDYFGMITEISAAVREKLRLTMFVGTKVITTFGPDMGSQAEPEVGLLIASDDQLGAEVMALAFLKNQFKGVSPKDRLIQKVLMKMNGRIGDLLTGSVWTNPVVKHALGLGWGDRKYDYNWRDVPVMMREELLEWLKD
jgi:uncharacterized protein (DUF362 family)